MQAQRTQTSEINATQSLNLVKNLLRSGLSCITFMRGMFPIDCFKQQKISGITVHTLQPVEAEPKKLIDWIDQGCLPSVEKRYLEELIFAIYAKLDIAGEDQFYLIETYNFQIRYHENDIVMTRKSQGLEITKSIPTKQEISQATVSMIRSLITMGGTMPPLPENRAFSIKLLYRDDITPEDYQPMHFFPVQSEHQLCFFSKPESVAIGNIATAYHELNLHVLVPEESEKELAIKFSSRENTSGEVYPAYTATINNSMSPTLSDFIIPCRFKDQSTSEEIPTHGEESISSRNNHCDNSADAQTSTVPISRSQASVFDLSQKPRAIERDAFAQNEDSIQCAATKQNYENLTFAEIIEILQAVRAGTFNKIPSDIYDLSPLAAERLDQLIGMHSSEAYDELKSLYLQLDIIMFLSGGIPMRMILSHFRGTKLTRSLIREHLNELVELGIATRNKKNQVVVNKSALLQTQTPRTLVDDDAETIAPEAMFPSKDTPRGMQEQAGQTSTDCLTTRLQKHIAKGVAAFTQSDIGASQISRASPRNVTKRKISTSDSIYQILKKRKRN